MRPGLFSSFLKRFPAPDFLTMPAVGLELSPEGVRFLELHERGGDHKVGRYGDFRLPENIDEAEFPSGEPLKNLLKEVRDKHKLGLISASLPEEKAYIFSTDLPELSDEEMRQALELKLEEHVPIPPKEAVFDYQVISTDHKAKRSLVSVSVMPRHLVTRYFDFFVSAGLTPVAFQVSAQAVAHAVVPYGQDLPLIIVNFGERQTGLYLVSHRVVHFTSVVAVGGDTLTEAIKKYFSVSKAEAEKIKAEHGITRRKEDTELFFSLVNSLSALKDEVAKLVSYWETHLDRYSDVRRGIAKVILCGRESGLQGLPEYLEANLGLSVELANVWCNVFSFDSYIPQIPRKESLAYAAVIGLSLRNE